MCVGGSRLSVCLGNTLLLFFFYCIFLCVTVNALGFLGSGKTPVLGSGFHTTLGKESRAQTLLNGEYLCLKWLHNFLLMNCR